MSWDVVEKFLSCVLPSPTPYRGYVNMHYSMVMKSDGRKVVSGRAFTSVPDLIGYAKWIVAHQGGGGIKDVWYCTSIQSSARINSHGKLGAVRLAANSLSLRAVWFDVDVDPADTTGKHYKTIEEAWGALVDFRTKNALPQFSAVVRSGGGLQAYFISNADLSPDSWKVYAEGVRALAQQHGLKFDSGLTTDNCRLLRIPNTFNHKYDPPRLVQLLPLPLVEYDFKTIFPTLPAPVASTTAVSTTLFDPALFPQGGMPSMWVIPDSLSLGAGIEPAEMPPLDPRPIFTQCGFFRDALSNGGADYDNPLWNLTLLGAAFMENGETIAHEVSKGHAKYVRAETQAQYERKVRERAERDLGWPSCAAIEGSGCKACAGCPLKGAIRSPLQLGRVTAPVIEDAKTPEDEPAPPDDDIERWMPPGYALDANGIVCWIEDKTDKNGNPLPTKLNPIFHTTCKVRKPWASWIEGVNAVNFEATTDLNGVIQVSVPQSLFGSPNELYKHLNTAGVKYMPASKAKLEDFFMALINKLHALAAAARTARYGWLYDEDKLVGFAFGGILYTTDGGESPTSVGDLKLKSYYTPQGNRAAWTNAAKIVMAEQRPELDVIIAASFASPLVKFTNKGCCVLSAFGQSGAHKSAAMDVGLAVWGHPRLTKQTKTSTQNSVLKHMGEAGMMPLYWDEITGKDVLAQFKDTLMMATQAVEKNRLDANSAMKHRGMWDTFIVSGGNESVMEFLTTVTTEHDGYINRVFEYNIEPRDVNATGMISDTVASVALAGLHNSYGIVGREYAKWLAVNIDYVQKVVNTYQMDAETELSIETGERFWKTTVALLRAGAHLARRACGVDFNEDALKDFLYKTYETSRYKKISAGLVTTKDGTEDLLDTYLKWRSLQQTIWCDHSPARVAGHRQIINIIHSPDNRNTQLPVVVRFDIVDRMLRISAKDFRKFMYEQQGSGYQSAMRSLSRDYGAKLSDTRYVLAAGTKYATAAEKLIEIPIMPNTPLEGMMFNHGGDNRDGKAAPSLATGITGTPITAAIMETVNADHDATKRMEG